MGWRDGNRDKPYRTANPRRKGQKHLPIRRRPTRRMSSEARHTQRHAPVQPNGAARTAKQPRQSPRGAASYIARAVGVVMSDLG